MIAEVGLLMFKNQPPEVGQIEKLQPSPFSNHQFPISLSL